MSNGGQSRRPNSGLPRKLEDCSGDVDTPKRVMGIVVVAALAAKAELVPLTAAMTATRPPNASLEITDTLAV